MEISRDVKDKFTNFRSSEILCATRNEVIPSSLKKKIYALVCVRALKQVLFHPKVPPIHYSTCKQIIQISGKKISIFN